MAAITAALRQIRATPECWQAMAVKRRGVPRFVMARTEVLGDSSGRLPLQGVEMTFELGDCLAVDLADPALGHTEHLADLCQGEPVVVVEAHDRARAEIGAR